MADKLKADVVRRIQEAIQQEFKDDPDFLVKVPFHLTMDIKWRGTGAGPRIFTVSVKESW